MYVNYGLTHKTIAEIFNVSKDTIRRRIKEFDIHKQVHSLITDNDLNAIVREILNEFPNTRIRRLKGFLLARGHKVQWERVRAALWAVDPEGVLHRSIFSTLIQRRTYSVPGPLALWHIDGNHKLIT